MRLIGLAVVLALSLALAPLAEAQKVPTIGYLGATTPAAQSEWTAAFVQRLRELAWIEGRSVAIEYRWAEGRPERSTEIVAEFVRLKVDVIVTGGTVNVLAAKQATSVIPIVFAAAGDPVGNGLVTSLARLHDRDGTFAHERDRHRVGRTPWHATQRAAWAALRKTEDDIQ